MRDYRCMTKAKCRGCTAHCRRHIISLCRHHVHSSVLSRICPLPTRYSSISAILNKPILDFSLSLIWAFPLAAHPAASAATLMVFSHINQLIKSKFQWWINLPELMRWSAACCYQSTCCQVIVSCWDVWHYEVHLEDQLSYNGSNRSKSIFNIGRLFVIHALPEKHSLSLLMSLMHVVLSTKTGAPSSLGIYCSLSPGVPITECGIHDCV